MKTRTFIDRVEVRVRSGKGGDGVATFRREALVSEGGPDGGIYYYQNIMGDKKKKTSRGGILRGMVNYSDSF